MIRQLLHKLPRQQTAHDFLVRHVDEGFKFSPVLRVGVGRAFKVCGFEGVVVEINDFAFEVLLFVSGEQMGERGRDIQC